MYIQAEDGGAGSARYGGGGASIYIAAGDAGTSLAGTGAAGGDVKITAGTASTGTAAADGTGGSHYQSQIIVIGYDDNGDGVVYYGAI